MSSYKDYFNKDSEEQSMSVGMPNALDPRMAEEINTSCSYIYLFHKNDDRIGLYSIVDDFMKGRDYDHFLTKYVDSRIDKSQVSINYKKLFTATQYNLKYIIDEYLDHVKVIKRLKGLKTPLTDEEEKRLAKFFELNDWNDKFKNIIKNRRVYGDDYYLMRIKNVEGVGKIPILDKMDRNNMGIVRSPYDLEEKEYIYTKEESKMVRDPDFPGRISEKTIKIQLMFIKGNTIPFINGEIEEDKIVPLPKEVGEYNPIIHFQYLKDSETDYSEIPALDFIDSILRLHRVETNISEINDKSGSGQLYVIDGTVDKKSLFGPRCIAYVDTTVAAGKSNRQAKLVQMEITNGLDSLYKEQETVLNALFAMGNLLSPALKELLAKSDSSKVIKYLSTDLIEELRIAYEEISLKTKPVWKVLFPDRADEDISLEIPLDLHASSLIDKGQYINANVMTIKEMLSEQGKSKEEIDQFLEDLNQQIQILKGNGIDAVPLIDTSLTDLKMDYDEKEKSDIEGYKTDEAPMSNPQAGR